MNLSEVSVVPVGCKSYTEKTSLLGALLESLLAIIGKQM